MIGTKILEERESKYNGKLRVIKTFGLGIYIQAGGLTQSGGIVESIWKSALKKIKNQKSKIKSCLILGLGGGTVAKLVGKFWPEAKTTGVDIDPVMIELGTRYLGLGTSGAKIVIQDAYNFIIQKSKIKNQKYNSKFKNNYDLIIVDLYNGDKYPKKFATENYMHFVRRILAKDGVAVFNRLYYGDKRSEAVKFGNKLQKVFQKMEWFYPEANLMLICKI